MSVENSKEVRQAIKRYCALKVAERKHDDRWGMLKSFPRKGEIDNAFRQCERLNCFAELRVELDKLFN